MILCQNRVSKFSYPCGGNENLTRVLHTKMKSPSNIETSISFTFYLIANVSFSDFFSKWKPGRLLRFLFSLCWEYIAVAWIGILSSFLPFPPYIFRVALFLLHMIKKY